MIKSVVVVVAGTVVTDPVGSIILVQQAYGHELLVFTVTRTVDTHIGALWDQVYLKWLDTDGTYLEFWGYLHNTEYSGSIGQRVQSQTVYCLGATMPMKNVNPRVIGKGTASYAIKNVVSRYSLGVEVDTTKTLIPSISQGQESDWAFVCRTAREAGLLVYARGPRVLAVDPLRVIADPALYSRSFNMELGPGSVNTMTSFKTVEDQLGAVTTKQTNLTSMGVDTVSGKLLQAFNPAGTRVATTAQHGAVTSLADAERMVNSGVRLSSNWVSAEASLVSSPSTTAATTVALTGTSVSTVYAGLWMVTGATHTLTWDFSQSRWTGITDVLLGRDRPYAASFLVNQNMTRPKPPIAGWVGNRWVNQGSTK